MQPKYFLSLLYCASATLVFADGPADNLPDRVRRVPPAGVKITETDRGELQNALAGLSEEVVALRTALKSKPALLELLPDLQIYEKAVSWALKYDEFFKTNEVQTGNTLARYALRAAA